MKIFTYLYDLFGRLSKHKAATPIMCINSFAESVFWPIPPDVMLIPMCIYQRKKSHYYALLTVIFSVLGAIVGYNLGYFLYDPYIADIVKVLHYEGHVETVRSWLTQEYGILMVFVGAFTPVPYKVIAVGTGLVAAEAMANTGSVGMLSLLNFVLVSFVGRGLRFFIEAEVIFLGGPKMENAIKRYIDIIGWVCVALFAIFIAYKILI